MLKLRGQKQPGRGARGRDLRLLRRPELSDAPEAGLLLNASISQNIGC